MKYLNKPFLENTSHMSLKLLKSSDLWKEQKYTSTIASIGVAKIKVCITLFNVWHMENKLKTHLTII